MNKKLSPSPFLKIGSNVIEEGKACFIIAEAGINHNGSVKLAKELVDAAKMAGADAIKFQTFKTEELVTKNTPQAGYQKKNAPAKSQYDMLKKLELSEKQFEEIYNYCKRKKLIFLSTPSDSKSAEFLFKLGVVAFKVGSGDLTNLPFIAQIASYNLPIILSTGMTNIENIKDAVKTVGKTGNKKLVLLHCTSEYPAKVDDLNLNAIATLHNHFKVPIGYSDHSQRIEVAIAARTLGACIIEKHLTISRNLKGPDHRASLEPCEFSDMVESIRNIERALGNGIKKPSKLELSNRKIVWRSLVAAKNLNPGEKIKRYDISIKRPGTGLRPKYLNKIIGKTLKNKLKKDQLIKWTDFQE